MPLAPASSSRGEPLGLTGATAPTQYVGGTVSGAPAAGTFSVGDFVIDQSGSAWVCTVAGSPGTWTQLSGGGGAVSSVFTRTGAVVAVSGDYTAALVTNAADKSSAAAQNFTGNVQAPALIASGLTGSVAASRYVGATASGAPATGAHLVGDFVIAQNGHVFVCTAAGTPGTWVDAGSVGNLVTSVFARTGAVVAASGDYTAAQVTNAADKAAAGAQVFTGNVQAPALIAAGLTGSVAASRYVGATASGAPATGTFAVGDFVIDQTGALWICTVAGTPGTWTNAGAGGYPNLSSNGSANLTADVTIAGSNAFADGPTLGSIGANGWTILLLAQTFLVTSSSSAQHVTVRIWDGTTTWAEGEIELGAVANQGQAIALHRILALTGAITPKLSAASDIATPNMAMKADPNVNSSATHNTTRLSYIRIA